MNAVSVANDERANERGMQCIFLKMSKQGHTSWVMCESIDISVYADTLRGRGGTVAAAPPPFRLGDPAFCESRPLVTPSIVLYELGDLLCFYMCVAVFCVVCFF